MRESNLLPIHDRMTQVQNPLDQPVGPSLPGWSPPPRPAPQPMSGRFCRVEPLEPATHAASLHRENSLDPTGAMWTYLPYGPFQSSKTYREWLAECARSRDPLFFAIVDPEWPTLERAFKQWLAPTNFDPQGRQRVRLSELTAPLRSGKSGS